MPVRLSPRDPSLEDPLPAEPFALLGRWLEEARQLPGLANPDAMAIASGDADGHPDLRMVLCRGFDAERGGLAFYTNLDSAKGRQLRRDPRAAALLHWDALSRQARVRGVVTPLPDARADAYFARRPRLSQLTAWASQQSRPIASRAALVEAIRRAAERFGGLEEGPPVPRPPFWGGLELRAHQVELWVGAEGRAHDRAEWRRADGAGAWTVQRLQP